MGMNSAAQTEQNRINATVALAWFRLPDWRESGDADLVAQAEAHLRELAPKADPVAVAKIVRGLVEARVAPAA